MLRISERDHIVEELQRFLLDKLGLEIGRFEAMDLLDFFTEYAGASYYNRGLHDAQAVLHTRASTIMEAIVDLEKPTPV